MVAAQSDRWEIFLQQLTRQLPEAEFRAWFSRLGLADFRDGKLTLAVPNKYVVDYIEAHHLDVLQQCIVEAFGQGTEVYYKVATAEPELPEPEQPAAPKLPELDPHLLPLFTFNNFVEGRSNKLARAVGLSIAQSPGKPSFNPFFLYGPSGVGKTHLVNAIGVQLRENFPNLRILFVPAHLFRTQYTDSVLHNKTNEFIHFYQTIDVLIIDDIQEITTAKTQQAFFHIFNHLQLIGHQIILTCDKPPSEFEGIEERMLTRFKSGMVVEMERPDLALRRAILRAKIRRDGLSISKPVVDFIVQNVESSVRELEGIVNSIMAYSVVDDCEISVELAQRVVARAVNLERRELTPEAICKAVCKHTGQRMKDLVSKSRKREIVDARQLAMYLCHKYTDLSYSQIGRLFGKRDHSTVLHACNQVGVRISSDRTFRLSVEEIESKLTQ